MRTFCVSDLHFGHDDWGDRSIDALARHVRLAGGPDDVLIAIGDHAVDDQGIITCLSKFHGFRGKTLAVAGNHDVWVGSDGDSWLRYLGLADVFKEAGFRPLEVEPVVIGDTAFVGSMGWYDYSFRDPLDIGIDAYRAKTYPGDSVPSWNDATYVRWRATDPQMTEWMAERLSRHLDLVADASRIVVAIHHVPTKRLLMHPRCFVPRRWRFANAFLGSERFREVISRHGNVRSVVNGHIHLARTVSVGGTAYASIGGGYDAKQLLVAEGRAIKRLTFSP